ncbi:MAG: hypothetical protein HY527_00640 [Betaproteobacteria bacterium]|nr:hypothetical protein [Betaproteobacteria bacterium]
MHINTVTVIGPPLPGSKAVDADIDDRCSSVPVRMPAHERKPMMTNSSMLNPMTP